MPAKRLANVLNVKAKVVKFIFALLISLGYASHSYAAVIAVEAGISNLKAAMEAAEDGDTLVLASGVYAVNGDNLFIDKSLIIRGADVQNKPVLSFQSYYDLVIGQNRNCEEDGEFSVTLQGLTMLDADSSKTNMIRITVEDNDYSNDAVCLTELNLLQNTLQNISLASTRVTNNGLSSGSQWQANDILKDNRFASVIRLIGNHIEEAGIYLNVKDYSYVAYNFINGMIHSYSHSDKDQVTYVIGNDIACNFNQRPFLEPNNYYQNGTPVYSSTYNYYNYNCIYANTGKGYIVGNTLQHHQADAEQNHGTIGLQSGDYVVANNLITTTENHFVNQNVDILTFHTVNLIGYGRIFNNTIVLSEDLKELTTNNDVIYASSNQTKVYNNILIDSPYNMVGITTSDSTYRYVSNNLCYTSAEESACTTDYNTLTSDPLLDTESYALGEDSPAIDAGFDDKYYYDLDGTIGDLGIHGGPYGFEQYQAQREDDSKPFVLPLFHNIGYVPGDTVQAKAIVIPRMK